MNQTFGRVYKLKSTKQIDSLFKTGTWEIKYPLKIVYLKQTNEDNSSFKCGFSVPKRFFKKAVERNYLKRLMREIVRKHKTEIQEAFSEPVIFMLVYSSKEISNYLKIEYLLKTLLKSIKLKHSIHE